MFIRHVAFSIALVVLGAGALNADPPAEPDLTDRWSGCWISDKNGHHGPLHATFCRTDACHYRVTFHGRFWKVIPFRYALTMAVVGRDGDKVLLSGSQPLGPLLGSFDYTATATHSEFTATFKSKNDCGRFELTRSCR
jgi:hypothetical protein